MANTARAGSISPAASFLLLVGESLYHHLCVVGSDLIRLLNQSPSSVLGQGHKYSSVAFPSNTCTLNYLHILTRMEVWWYNNSFL